MIDTQSAASLCVFCLGLQDFTIEVVVDGQSKGALQRDEIVRYLAALKKPVAVEAANDSPARLAVKTVVPLALSSFKRAEWQLLNGDGGLIRDLKAEFRRAEILLMRNEHVFATNVDSLCIFLRDYALGGSITLSVRDWPAKGSSSVTLSFAQPNVSRSS